MQRTTTRKVARLRRRTRRQRNHQLPRHRRRQLLLRVNRRLAQVQPLAAPLPPLPPVVRARRVQAPQPRRHLPLPPPRRLQPTQPPIPVPQTRIRWPRGTLRACGMRVIRVRAWLRPWSILGSNHTQTCGWLTIVRRRLAKTPRRPLLLS